MDMKSRCQLSLGDQPKQTGDERDLLSDVPLFHSIHLSFPKHIHTFVSL